MEERIIEDEGRTIKVKRNALGGIEDAPDGALPEGGTAEGASSPEAGPGGTEEDVEFAVDFPEEEYDEDMVGLTPSQLKRAQEERERARREAEEARDKLIAEGKKALSSLDYAAAEKLYSQALAYDEESAEALLGVWESRTQGFTDDSPFFIEENAEKFAGMPEEVRAPILERVESRLQDARQGILEEIRPLKAAVEEAREARRGALFSALSKKVADGELIVVDKLEVPRAHGRLLRLPSPHERQLARRLHGGLRRACPSLPYLPRRLFARARLCASAFSR